MLVGTHEHEIAPIERARIGILDIKDGERHAPLRRRADEARNADIRVEAQERVIRSEGVVERPAKTQPQMRRSASRNGGRRKVTDAVRRMRFAVVGDDWRVVVEVAEIQSGTAILLDVEIVSLMTDALARSGALRSVHPNLGPRPPP